MNTLENTFSGFGPPVNGSQLIRLLDDLLDFSGKPPEEGLWQLPLCIWGKAGIGKTALIHDYARRRDYRLVHLAPAQIEEMGDLLGMPAVEGGKTIFRQPQWAPEEEGPGILLIDDFNRADERIIKGMMQLFQEKKLLAWQLPPRWSIVLTANPETHQYQVTPLDQALITRLMHFTMIFDLRDWVSWAEQHELPAWCIDFALMRRELFEHERNTPRTFAQFAHQVKRLNLTVDAGNNQLFLLAQSMLGETTAVAIKNYLKAGFQQIPDISRILATDDFEKEIAALLNKWNRSETGQRVDLFSLLTGRLNAHLEKRKSPLSEKEMSNLKLFLLLPALPGDFRFQLAQDWASSANDQLKQLISDPDVAHLVL